MGIWFILHGFYLDWLEFGAGFYRKLTEFLLEEGISFSLNWRDFLRMKQSWFISCEYIRKQGVLYGYSMNNME